MRYVNFSKCLVMIFMLPMFLFANDRRESLYQYMTPNGIGCEVGVFNGDFSQRLLENVHPTKLYLIDPWALYRKKSPFQGEGNILTQKDWDAVYQNVCDRFKDRPEVVVIRDRGEAAADFFEDETFDWIYIDGDHSYEGSFVDFFKYFPRLKPGGVLIADDFTCLGVRKAFTDFRKISKDIDFIKVEDSTQLIVFKKKKE
jgi:hypothetical protein